MIDKNGALRCKCGAVADTLYAGKWTCIDCMGDEGSASLFAACLLAGCVPALLVVVFLAHLLGAMSGAMQA